MNKNNSKKNGKKNGRNNGRMGYDDLYAQAMGMYGGYDDVDDNDVIPYHHHSTTRINEQGNIEKTETIEVPADAVIEEDVVVTKNEEVHDTDTPMGGDCDKDESVPQEVEDDADASDDVEAEVEDEVDDADYDSIIGLTDELKAEIDDLEIEYRKKLVYWDDALDKVVLHVGGRGRLYIDDYEEGHRYKDVLLDGVYNVTASMALTMMIDNPNIDRGIIRDLFAVMENLYMDGLLVPDYRNKILEGDDYKDLLPCEKRVYSARLAKIVRERDAEKQRQAENARKEQEQKDADEKARKDKEENDRQQREAEEQAFWNKDSELKAEAEQVQAELDELLATPMEEKEYTDADFEDDEEFAALLAQYNAKKEEERKAEEERIAREQQQSKIDDAQAALDVKKQALEDERTRREDAKRDAALKARNARMEEMRKYLAGLKG